MTKRELLKHMHSIWRKVGRPLPRGGRLPALNDALPMIQAVAGTAALAFKRGKAGNPMEVDEIAHELEARCLSH